MSLVATATVESYCGASSGDADIALLHPGVEIWIANECGRVLEEATYIERRNGDGTQYLTLYNDPVTAIDRISVGKRTGLSVEMTSGADASSLAIVQVTATQLRLKVEGGTNAHAWESFTLADYTLATLAAETFSTGWTVGVYDTDYNTIQASDLIQVAGASALDTTLYLDIPEAPESHYELYGDGTVYLWENTFNSGHRNVLVEYTAGYTSSTVPADLKYAILYMCKALYQDVTGDAEGLKSYSLGDISKTFRDRPEFPGIVLSVVNRYMSHPV